MSLQITHSGIFSQDMIQWDTDAADYLGRVAIADGQALEAAVAMAVNEFFVGCKIDTAPLGGTNFEALAFGSAVLPVGARTLEGALQPITAGATITNFNFTAGDYNRKTGLKGNGSNKRIGMGVDHTASGIPENDRHLSVWQTEHQSLNNLRCALGVGSSSGGVSQLLTSATLRYRRINTSGGSSVSSTPSSLGFWGLSRVGATSYNERYGETSTSLNVSNQTLVTGEMVGFSRATPSSPNSLSDGRLAWLSFCRAISSPEMEDRLEVYLAAINAAIP